MANVLRIDTERTWEDAAAADVRDRLVRCWGAHDVTSLRGPNVVPANVDAAVPGADLVTASGHGEYSCFLGASLEPVWADRASRGLLAGKVVHLLACRSAVALGTELVRAGVVAFWGYTADFQLERGHLDLLLGMDAELLDGLLSGGDAEQVHRCVTAYLADAVRQPLPTAVRERLVSNYAALARPGSPWGDGSAVVR